MGYFSTDTQSDLDIAAGVEMREYEIASYQSSKTILQAIYDSYSNIDWDESTIEYKTVNPSEVCKQLSGEKLELVGKLQHKLQVEHQLKMTEIEMRKSQAAYEALIGCISTERLVAAITTYKANKTN